MTTVVEMIYLILCICYIFGAIEKAIANESVEKYLTFETSKKYPSMYDGKTKMFKHLLRRRLTNEKILVPVINSIPQLLKSERGVIHKRGKYFSLNYLNYELYNT